MFKDHPKGLIVLFFANMGERFGYYTMLTIFVLYLQAYFGWDASHAGRVYGFFLFGIYFFPILGGFISDKVLGYGKTITLGCFFMGLGYFLLGQPGMSEWATYGCLGVIALGVGLFKGNLAVLVGNLYDRKEVSHLRDAAFNLYYMGINIGAFFAPHAATSIRNWLLEKDGFTYHAALPELAHRFLKGKLADPAELQALASAQLGGPVTDLGKFCSDYLSSLAQSYNAGFVLAAGSMIISLIIFLACRKFYQEADIRHKDKKAAEGAVELTPQQVKDRLVALALVFFVVIFFWLAFHQNGFTLTLFAKNYTVGEVGRLTFILFDLPALLGVVAAVWGLVLLIGRNFSGKLKGVGAALLVVGGASASIRASSFQADGNPITAELFQAFNPIFIVFLTPVVIGVFSLLRQKGIEPGSPAKIGIGMFITAIGFGLMLFASAGLQSVHALQGGVSPERVSPYWLINVYLILTFAELFLSPMGLSFVSKVSPPQYKGLMQGGWLGATALGNLAAGFIGPFYEQWELWQFFLMVVVLALVSFTIVMLILKKLNRAISS